MSPDAKEKLMQDLRDAAFVLDLARRNLAESTKRFADARTRLRDLETAWRQATRGEMK